jgi:hypothetical protein
MPRVTTAGGEHLAPSRSTRLLSRPLAQGVGAALVAAALAAGQAVGPRPLAAVVLVVQVLLVVAVLSALDAPSPYVAGAVAVAAAVAADLLVLAGDGEVGTLAGVVGLALVAALLGQLADRGRTRVTAALADTMLGAVLVTAAACLVALRDRPSGGEALLVLLVAAGAALLAGRLVDEVLPRPALSPGAARGGAGLLLALAVAVGAAVLTAGNDGRVTAGDGALLGLVAGVAVCAADLAVALGTDGRGRRRAAAGALLPFAVLGPVALVAGRLALA